MSEVNALTDRLFDTVLDRYMVDASLMGFDLDHESLVDHSEEADHRYQVRLHEIRAAAQRLQLANLSGRVTLGVVPHEVRTQSDDIDGRQIEFGISANIRTTVPGTLAFLPRLPVDTPERQAGYLRRLRRLDEFFTTMITRHRKGFANGRTPVRHLVEPSTGRRRLPRLEHPEGARADRVRSGPLSG